MYQNLCELPVPTQAQTNALKTDTRSHTNLTFHYLLRISLYDSYKIFQDPNDKKKKTQNQYATPAVIESVKMNVLNLDFIVNSI